MSPFFSPLTTIFFLPMTEIIDHETLTLTEVEASWLAFPSSIGLYADGNKCWIVADPSVGYPCESPTVFHIFRSTSKKLKFGKLKSELVKLHTSPAVLLIDALKETCVPAAYL